MKFKLLLLIGITAFVLSFGNVKDAIPGIQRCMSFKETLQERQAEIERLQGELQNAVNLAEGQELGRFGENMEIVHTVEAFDGCSIASIAALRTAGSPLEEAVLTITDIEEASYFTDTINEMAFCLDISDAGKVFKSAVESGVPFTAADYQAEPGILVLRVPTVTAENNAMDAAKSVIHEADSSEAESASVPQPDPDGSEGIQPEGSSVIGGIIRACISPYEQSGAKMDNLEGINFNEEAVE